MAMIRTAIIAAIGVGLAIPAASYACSKRAFYGLRAANRAHFIGTATPDILFAGVGGVRYAEWARPSDPTTERPVFGQVVSVERIGGLAAKALRQPVLQVVLVPWAYGPDCVPIPFRGSWAWLNAGTRGLFSSGVLRDSAHWAGGVPTFDVFAPQFEPYPQLLMPRGSRSADASVPVDELFELMELFPADHLLPDSAEAATAPLFAWARANPGLTRRYPIADAISGARYAVARQRLRAIKSPLFGTYKMTLAMSGTPTRTFYARTRGVPTSEWNAGGPLRPPVEDPAFVPRPDGYHLLAAVAESLASLPENCERGRDSKREGYIVVVHPPPDSTPDPQSWTGKLEVSLAQGAFRADTVLNRFARDEFDAFRRRSRARLGHETPARFARSEDGTIRVEQQITLEDGRSLTMSGVRISHDVVACRYD